MKLGRNSRHRIAVVYLAWAPAGREAFVAFLDSLRANPPGLPNDLIILFKGFSSPGQLQTYKDACADLEHQARVVADVGFDLRWYVHTARDTDADFFCFFNSYSRVLVPGWLALLHDALRAPRIGAAGATGSWESLWTDFTTETRLHPTYPPLLRARRVVLDRYLRLQFPPWPNPHLRTTGFLISKRAFVALHHTGLSRKPQDHRFESGRRSLTRQLAGRGLGVRVVGRDGRAFEPEEWPTSGTFRTIGQPNLLVSDNRTRQYDSADGETQDLLQRLTWGAP